MYNATDYALTTGAYGLSSLLFFFRFSNIVDRHLALHLGFGT